jgi:hypothetical protein
MKKRLRCNALLDILGVGIALTITIFYVHFYLTSLSNDIITLNTFPFYLGKFTNVILLLRILLVYYFIFFFIPCVVFCEFGFFLGKVYPNIGWRIRALAIIIAYSAMTVFIFCISEIFPLQA